MTLILDASVLTPLFVNHQLSDQATEFRYERDIILPALAFVETTNAVWKYVRAGSAKVENMLQVREALQKIASEIVPDQELLNSAIVISVANHHSVYDCLYLALAQLKGGKLVTADKRMATISKSIAIPTQLVTANS